MLIAKINEDDCVGCNKCHSACPVDAIIGAVSFNHSVIADECIGCKLCVAPCPTDCIEIIDANTSSDKNERLRRANLAKLRHSNKMLRLAKKSVPALPIFSSPNSRKTIVDDYIKGAIARKKEVKKYGT